MLSFVPPGIVPLVVFNIVGIALGGDPWAREIFSLPLASGAVWQPTFGDLMVAIGVVFFAADVLKASQGPPFLHHVAAALVSLAFVLEFAFIGAAANGTFLTLTFLSLAGTVTGAVVAVRIGRLRRRARAAEGVPPVEREDVEERIEPRLGDEGDAGDAGGDAGGDGD